MARKRYTAEEIIGPLRTSEIETGKGVGIAEVCRKLGDHGTELRNELVNGEPFYTLQEAPSSKETGIVPFKHRNNTCRIFPPGVSISV